MTEATRKHLSILQANGDLSALAEYCETQLREDTDELTRGCFLWNLSDAYAMIRDSHALYHNHRRFEAHIRAMPAMYRLWLVCDGTQRLSLELGGHDDFWWTLYREATEKNDPLCETILFEAHRAAFLKSPAMPYGKTRAQWVNDRFVSFLEAVGDTDDAPFYRLIYTALCLKQFGEADGDIIVLCEPFLPDLCLPREERPFAAGEWEMLNGKRSKHNRAQVGINNAVNALIDSGELSKARGLYGAARQYGMLPNTYIEKRMKM